MKMLKLAVLLLAVFGGAWLLITCGTPGWLATLGGGVVGAAVAMIQTAWERRA